MAKVDMKLPEEFLLRLSRLGEQTDKIVVKALQAGGEVVLAKVKSNLSATIGSGIKSRSRSTGELEKSLGLSPTKIDRDGNLNVKIGFSEPRSDGGSNAKLANILEYGKSGQPPRPFLKPAKSATKSACQDAMIQKFEEEVSKL